MPQLTKEWIDLQREKHENTWVAKTASGWIVIAHPSQKPPDPKDRKFLRENFGLLDDVKIMRSIDSDQSPDFERLERELALQESDIDERIRYHKHEFLKLSAEKMAQMGLAFTPAAAVQAEADLLAEAAAQGEPDEDDEKTVATVGGRGSARGSRSGSKEE